MTAVQISAAGLLPLGVLAADADPALQLQLQQLAQRRVYFGHQSVGENLIEGLQQLAAASGVNLPVLQLSPGANVPPGTFAHNFVGENGQPMKKLQNFTQVLTQQSSPPDLALLKFCFLDFTAQTDPKQIFARYQAELASLHNKLPGTRFVHVTAPLTTIESGPKATLKRWLGRTPYGVVENQRREEYNQLLRQAYAGKEPLFDLARVESTTEDGQTTRTSWNGINTAALTPTFTDDGSHLNAVGKRVAGRALVAVLAAASSAR